MSENAMYLQIVTPHGCLYDAGTLGVRLESVMGQMELLPDHEPMISALEIGAAVVKREEGDLHFALNHGYVEVLNNHIEIVVETAEEASAIDLARAKEGKARAEERMAEVDASKNPELASQIDEDMRLEGVRIAVGTEFGGA